VTGVRVRRAGERFRSTYDGVDAWHCLSYGEHYDPDNTSFGVLVACNDFTVAPGRGFEEHRHAELEIVSWVLAGALHHEDSVGYSAVLRPGLAQRLSAGTGIRHAETNAGEQPLRFVQMWVLPDRPALPPSYDQADLTAALGTGELIPVASGRPGAGAPLRLRQAAATLHAAALPGSRGGRGGRGGRAGRELALPAAPYVQVYVARGSVDLTGSGRLMEGDEARLTGAAGLRVAATDRAAEILVWEMHDRI
jgi:redox-sensitive bicupin YhaK (pirin superfamily)